MKAHAVPSGDNGGLKVFKENWVAIFKRDQMGPVICQSVMMQIRMKDELRRWR